MGLLPAYWSGFSASPTHAGAGRQFWSPYGLWLGPGPSNTVGVGLFGAFPELELVLSRYGKLASATYFPAPLRLTEQTREGQGLLLMLFTPAQLQRAVGEGDRPDPR
jgi:hypothetical protein